MVKLELQDGAKISSPIPGTLPKDSRGSAQFSPDDFHPMSRPGGIPFSIALNPGKESWSLSIKTPGEPIIGIANAMSFAGSGAVEMENLLAPTTQRLAVAFYTTLVALLQSGVLVLGTDDAGRVALYRGLPYELPFGESFYELSYSTAVQTSELPPGTVNWAVRTGFAGSDTSNRDTWVPEVRPESSASWPTPSRWVSSMGCR